MVKNQLTILLLFKIQSKTMKSKIVLCGLLLSNYIGITQTPKYGSLRIGDLVPDVAVSNVLNYPGGKVRLSDFRGKVVILDFWNTGCAPCIAAMPKMQHLQEQFDDKIQILLVDWQNSTEQVQQLFKKNTYIKDVHLP